MVIQPHIKLIHEFSVHKVHRLKAFTVWDIWGGRLFYIMCKKIEKLGFFPILAKLVPFPAVVSLTFTPLEKWRPVVQRHQSPEGAFKG